MAKSRLIGEYPAIGIRRIIDGRRGPLKVRESLEDQTMMMAQAVKKLYEENLRYSDGTPVRVVISDTSIGASTPPKDPARSISPACLPATPRKGFPHSASTAERFRRRMIKRSPPMLKKNFSDLPERALPPPQ